jgi:hypothetical protein
MFHSMDYEISKIHYNFNSFVLLTNGLVSFVLFVV